MALPSFLLFFPSPSFAISDLFDTEDVYPFTLSIFPPPLYFHILQELCWMHFSLEEVCKLLRLSLSDSWIRAALRSSLFKLPPRLRYTARYAVHFSGSAAGFISDLQILHILISSHHPHRRIGEAKKRNRPCLFVLSTLLHSSIQPHQSPSHLPTKPQLVPLHASSLPPRFSNSTRPP